ncbi:MAG: T9SS type A sorting domain-containing protein [Bacteroidia bacterium]|nr:T9SS type A sorting domain-containing protein [Bacteroidia bacterium]
MKKILLSLLSFSALTVSAQLTQSNHAFVAGDTYSTVPCNTVGISPGAGGAGATWNYSVTPSTTVTTNYAASTSTNTAYNPANIFVTAGSNNSSYYLASSTELKYFGGDMVINTFNLNFIYSSPAYYAVYPMSLNTTTTVATSGSVTATAPLAGSGTFSGSCTVLADGTGTLVLPSKTFTDIIRVKTNQDIVATISSITATVNTEVYDYYSPSASKAPILTINTSTINSIMGSSTQTFVTAISNYSVVGVNENQKSTIELSVYPNPSSTVVNFETQSQEAYSILAFDVTGRMISNAKFELGKAQLNLDNIAKGVYIYQVVNKQNETLKTGKFNVSK